MSFNDVQQTGNNTVGNTSYAWCLSAYTTTTGLGTLSLAAPRFSSMCALYRQFRLLSITVEYVPAVSSTDKGMIALGIDPAPLSGLPSGYSSVVRHSVAKMFDIKATASLTYKPALDAKKDPRYTNAMTGNSEDEYSFGVLQLFSQGNSVGAVGYGFLRFHFTVEFLGPF